MTIEATLNEYGAKLRKAKTLHRKEAVLARLQGRADALSEVGTITAEEKKVLEDFIARSTPVRARVGRPFPKRKVAPAPSPEPPKKDEQKTDEKPKRRFFKL